MSPEDMMRIIIRVADELGLPDKRGACIIAGMTVAQESDFWRPGNNADPAFKANPDAFQHDSMGDDGKSVGPYQQQTSGPPPAPQWGWGGLYGDPEGTRKRMDPYESTKLFLAALKREPYRAGNAREANDWAQRVQKSGVPDAYAKHWDRINRLYDAVKGGAQPPAPSPAPATYGMPRGSNSGGYGGGGVRFPDWVYALGNAFGLKPSTYPGHQENDRNEAGYARNPERLNRGIDWAAPGAPDELDRLTRFADYLATIPQHLEQVIWQNPRTMRSIEVAGGRHQPGYFRADLAGHRDHVHTRQSKPIPAPGGGGAPPAPRPEPARPQFEERQMFGQGGSKRSRSPINFFIHTEEGNGSAESLARYCQGQNGVSYHYTLRDRIVYDVVDTDLYSWSVLSANVFSINLCFAGSRASMSRDEWIKREGDIEVAAYLAVQDARKYGFSTEVLAPPYTGQARAGISDHKYVTQKLGIGDHTDVGPNFPWDVFARYVTKYANTQTPAPIGDDDLSAEAERMIREMYAEYRKEKQAPSRAFLAEDGSLIESPLGFIYNIDGNLWDVKLTLAYLFHVPLAIEVVEHVAATGCYPASWAGAQPWLNEFGQAYCQGLVAFKKRLVTKLTTASTSTGGQVDVGGLMADLKAAIDQRPVVANATVDTSELNRLHDENARLREELARAQALQVVYRDTSPAPVNGADHPTDTPEAAASVIRSVQDWTQTAIGMGTPERAALAASLKVLALENGNQP